MDKFVVTNPFTGEEEFRLNERLMKSQGKLHNLEAIKKVHQTKMEIHVAILNEKNPKLLKSYADDLTLCEFELQKLWGFKEDAKFHRFWLTPGCICPRMDNEENYGVGYYTVVLSCPLHGNRTT
jgi:hypothetical protein